MGSDRIHSAIASGWPEAYQADRQTSLGDVNKLGTFSKAEIELNPNDTLSIYNLYAQFEPGKRFEYLAFKHALDLMFEDILRSYDHCNVHIAFPKVGSGIGGGDWNIISHIIEDINEPYGYDLTLIEFTTSNFF